MKGPTRGPPIRRLIFASGRASLNSRVTEPILRHQLFTNVCDAILQDFVETELRSVSGKLFEPGEVSHSAFHVFEAGRIVLGRREPFESQTLIGSSLSHVLPGTSSRFLPVTPH